MTRVFRFVCVRYASQLVKEGVILLQWLSAIVLGVWIGKRTVHKVQKAAHRLEVRSLQTQTF